MDKFSILATEDLQLWERELSVSQHDIFFRKLQAKEKPLELFLLWKLNGERKSMVLMDHDPNMARFKNCPLDELELRVHNLDTEEQDLIQSIKDNYEKAKDVINELLINGVD
jgi:alpha-D-ribose 1-methylphosphonate 5-triphosphate diphosphatase PhnM